MGQHVAVDAHSAALKPGSRAAYAVVFLSIAKELPITLTLIPLGCTTLAYRVFDGQQEATADVGLAGVTAYHSPRVTALSDEGTG